MAEGRVTTHRIEALAQPDSTARVTTHREEVLAAPDSTARVTTHRIEALVLSYPPAGGSQAVII